MAGSGSGYFLETGRYGLRLYDHERDEEAVCRLCWSNALPHGRPFPLIPEAGAYSFGRIVTGPFAEYCPDYFYVADDLETGRLIGYLTGAEGGAVTTPEGKLSWMAWRNTRAEQIAEEEFGEISLKLYLPVYRLLEGVKFLYTVSLGLRAIRFLLHEKFHSGREIPRLPACPEFHFQVEKGHRGRGLGGKLIEHFLLQLAADKYKRIGAQVTVCAGQVPLAYYQRMTVEGERLWRIYDRRESAIYTDDEKKEWGLGPVVENVSLIADKKRLLAFVTGSGRSEDPDDESKRPRRSSSSLLPAEEGRGEGGTIILKRAVDRFFTTATSRRAAYFSNNEHSPRG